MNTPSSDQNPTGKPVEKPAKKRRGRPRAGEREARKGAVLDATMAELVEKGFEAVTMLGVASRAGTSKESLYTWFGNRDGLFAALIERNADQSAERVRAALDGDGEPEAILTGYCIGLLNLLTSDVSIALNRAAMPSPELAVLLLQGGRHRIGPLVEQYLAKVDATTQYTISDPPSAFMLLYGLAVQDTQIRVLLGEVPPSQDQIREQAALAVSRFFSIVD